MSKKSDSPWERRISATEASRSFSRLLDEVERGHRFVVHRRGRDVCAITLPPADARHASECLALLRGRSPVILDDAFGADLLAVLEEEPVEERPRWDS